MHLLDKINSPSDLKKLPPSKLAALAAEIRQSLIHSVAKTGGHLSSNLGVVELTIALHYCLSSPRDKIVWDVGHQAYPHKILTGRKDDFLTLRQLDGLSGFIKSAESPHDCFDVGHSSTSLSAALGFALARDLQKSPHRVCAVIGDGSLTCGLALEGLNNIGRSNTNMVVFLNDNQMSISENVGAISRYLNSIRQAPTYISAKEDIRQFLKSIPYIGVSAKKLIQASKDRLKYLMLPGVLFQELGFKYYGPIDGHDFNQLLAVIENTKKIPGPILVHVVTKKGKGYPLAEKFPKRFHGTSPFNPKNGSPLAKSAPSFTDIFSKKIVDIAANNKNLVAITAAMPMGCGLEAFSKSYPDRFFDVGIAEGHAVTFAAGLAKGGMAPIVSIYSTFLQRAYDQILHDVCIQNLPVVFAIDRAGIVPEDGETHQGIFDLSYLAHMPNMTILAPKDGKELCAMLDYAFTLKAPVAIRYPKAPAAYVYQSTSPIIHSKSQVLEEGHGKHVAIVAVGSMVNIAYELVQMLKAKWLTPRLINPRFIKPIDPDMVSSLCDFKHIITLEENVHTGGFGQRLGFELMAAGSKAFIHNFAINDEFLPTGTREQLLEYAGLNAQSIFDKTIKLIEDVNDNTSP